MKTLCDKGGQWAENHHSKFTSLSPILYMHTVLSSDKRIQSCGKNYTDAKVVCCGFH